MNTKASLLSEVNKLKSSYAKLSPFWRFFYPLPLKYAIENDAANNEFGAHRIIEAARQHTWFFHRWIFAGLSDFFKAPIIRDSLSFFQNLPFKAYAVTTPLSLIAAMYNYKKSTYSTYNHTAHQVFKPLLTNNNKIKNETIIVLLSELGLLSNLMCSSNLGIATKQPANELFLQEPYGERMIALLTALKPMANTAQIQKAFDAEIIKRNTLLAAAVQQRQQAQAQAQQAQVHPALGGWAGALFRSAAPYGIRQAAPSSSSPAAAPMVAVNNETKLADIGFSEQCLTKDELKRYDDYLCKIGLTIMSDPVHTADCPLQNFERSNITQWIQQKYKHPITKKFLAVSMLQSNVALKKEIETFVEQMVAAAAAAPSMG